MAEANVNREVVHHLGSAGAHGAGPDAHRRRIEVVEILEAVLLAVVALATAYSGFQAARWDGESAKAYARSSTLRAESSETHLTANQTLAYDAGTFTAWLQAMAADDKNLARLLARRFTPEYRAAFDAWLRARPFSDPDAPPGPRSMPQYRDPLTERGDALARAATAAFEEGTTTRHAGEQYVRLTVILAAVLFLIAVGQKFSIRGVRVGVSLVAGAFLAYCLALILVYPHT